jgi:hypothetical protein
MTVEELSKAFTNEAGLLQRATGIDRFACASGKPGVTAARNIRVKREAA